jgi:hypothetical protein
MIRYYSFKYDLFEIQGSFTDKPAYSETYELMHYETINFIPHQYTFLIFSAIVLACGIFFVAVIKCTVKNFKIPCCRKIGVNMPNSNFFGRIIARIFYVCSLELFISCYIGFKSVDSVESELDRNTADGISVITAVTLLGLYFPGIARMCWVVLANFNDLADSDVRDQYEHYYVDLDILRRGQVLYHVVFILRRLLFCVILFWAEGHPNLQCSLHIGLTMLVILYVANFKPFHLR